MISRTDSKEKGGMVSALFSCPMVHAFSWERSRLFAGVLRCRWISTFGADGISTPRQIH